MYGRREAPHESSSGLETVQEDDSVSVSYVQRMIHAETQKIIKDTEGKLHNMDLKIQHHTETIDASKLETELQIEKLTRAHLKRSIHYRERS